MEQFEQKKLILTNPWSLPHPQWPELTPFLLADTLIAGLLHCKTMDEVYRNAIQFQEWHYNQISEFIAVRGRKYSYIITSIPAVGRLFSRNDITLHLSMCVKEPAIIAASSYHSRKMRDALNFRLQASRRTNNGVTRIIRSFAKASQMPIFYGQYFGGSINVKI